MKSTFRHASAIQLADALQESRHYTLTLIDSFVAVGIDSSANVPMLPAINPPLWELGRIAWFAEWFVLREAQSSNPVAASRPSMLTMGDDWFDANTVAHRARWTLELPSAGALRTYCNEVLDRVLDKLSRVENDDDATLYPYRLVLAHEDARGETLACALQTLGIAAPTSVAEIAVAPHALREICFPGGSFTLGSTPDNGFVFDNEKWAHPFFVPAFVMDSCLISNAQYCEFIADGGYQNSQFWSAAGRAWLMQQESSAPRYWQRGGRVWHCEKFGEVVTLAAHEPVRHICLYEAQAYCAWARRRLPTEAEWEFAVLSGNAALHWGDLWEWTSTPFEPYRGFAADAFLEYSEPCFMTHQTVRGASFATHPRMRSPKYRGFYLPERDDIFVGFRTCAV